MNIQDELKNDRLAVDAETPHVFIREDLYRELLDTSMFPYALKAIRMTWWKKGLLKLMLMLNHNKYEQMVMEQQFRYYLQKLLDYVTEERIRILGMSPASVVTNLNFTVTDENAKPLYVGVYQSGEFYIRAVV